MLQHEVRQRRREGKAGVLDEDHGQVHRPRRGEVTEALRVVEASAVQDEDARVGLTEVLLADRVVTEQLSRLHPGAAHHEEVTDKGVDDANIELSVVSNRVRVDADINVWRSRLSFFLIIVVIV